MCEVTLDDRTWPRAESEPRPVRHGSYAKIVVPPPQGYEVDTMVAADALHTDSQTDAIMDLLGDDFGDEDAAFLTQVTKRRLFPRSVTAHLRDIFDHRPFDPCLDLNEPSQTSSRQDMTCRPSLSTESTLRNGPETDLCAARQDALPDSALGPKLASGLSHGTVTPADTACALPVSCKQPTLFMYFSRSPQGTQAALECPLLDRKCNEAHQQEPPAIMQAIPQPLPQAPNPRPRPIWHLELQSIFDELATVRFHETGRTLFVSVWYIHHGRYATCHAPRHVELDDTHELWYADLCNAWWDQIQRTMPMRVLIVKPNPDNQLAPRAQRHIILEQGFQPDRAAIIFTAIFLANFRNGIFQKAESVDIRISAQYIIDKYDFNVYCDFRPCTLTSGIMRFHQHVLEEIFSGISVQLVVGPPHSARSASSSSLPMPHVSSDQTHGDHTEFMQRARRWQRPRQETLGSAAASTPAAPSAGTVQQSPNALPSVMLADMRDFRATLQWMVQQATDACLDTADAPVRIQTWFLDSNRRSRSEEPRSIALRPLPHTWVPDIIARWRDEIDPHVILHLHVVQPMPSAGTDDIHAHVILVQNPNDLWRAALVSIVYFDQDPWNPAYVATMLDAETTIEQIAFRTHVVHPANPRAQHFQVEVRHASVTLDSRSPFHVRDGYHFELVVFDNSDPWADSVALIQMSFTSIKANMRDLHKQIECAQRQCMIMPTHQSQSSIAAISIAQDPRNPAVASPWDSLPFHGYLQALWQPLSLLSPDATRPVVRVTTWYLDHIRYPQSFEARDAGLTGDPHGWLRQMRRLWYDVILPHDPLHFHIVQPHPPSMQMDVAAHIILVQQPVEGFKSVLITLFDSAFIGEQVDRFATMAPSPITFPTLVGLAYRDIDCQDPANTCDAWVGREELHPTAQREVINGHSLVVSVHRGVFAPEGAGDPWQSTMPKACPHHSKRRSQEHPVPIYLDACLPADDVATPQFQEDASTILWFANSNWKRTVAESLGNHLCTVPVDLYLPEPTCEGIMQSVCAPFDPHAHPIYEIYIDGATGSTHAGWAAVVVACTPDSRRLLGVTGGTVELSPSATQWVGADRPDNIAAELTALLAAHAIILQQDTVSQFCIRPDLSLSRIIAQELSTTKAHPRLAQLCRVVSCWNKAKAHYLEVRGHTQDPWNELADAVAKYCTQPNRSSAFAFSFAPLHALAIEAHDIAWDWLHYEQPALSACLPPCFDETVVQITACQPPQLLPVAAVADEDPPQAFHVKVATINVLALEHTEQHSEVGRRQGGRTARIDAQFHAAHIHAVGLQETRTAKGRFQSENYQILASGCQTTSAAHLGCELWLHKQLVVSHRADGTPLRLNDGHITVQVADPRRLIVHIDFATCTCTFAVLHAPCLQKSQGDGHHPIERIQHWWSETTDIIRSLSPSTLMWVCIDANAALATEETQFFGMHDAGRATPQTECFETFLREIQLYVPSTFAHIHHGPSHTWSHSNGNRHRIDYVLANQDAFQLTKRTSVMLDYDGSFTHDDHIPVILEAEGWVRITATPHKIKWDEDAMLDPTRCAQFQEALASLPLPTWQTHPNDHCQIYEKQLLALARQFFERKSSARRRPQLSPSTMQAIAMKRHVLDCGRAFHLMHDPEFKAELKALEIDVRCRVRKDLAFLFDQILVRLQDAGLASDFKAMYGAVTRLGGKRHKRPMPARPLPMLKTPNGAHAQTFMEQQQIWLDQFSAIEAGIVLLPEEVTATPANPCMPIDTQQPQCFPTAWQIQAEVAKLKRGKTPGPNQITPSVLKAAGPVFAKQLAILTTKAAAHAVEPFAWRGGVLVPLHKGKGPPDEPQSYRSIFVSNYTGKLYHRAIRAQLEAVWEAKISSLQLGSRRGMGTDLAHHLLEAHQAACYAKGLPTAVVFFDMRAAFYSVLRQSLMHLPQDPTALVHALRRLGVSQQDIHQWIQATDDDNATEGACLHLQHMVRDTMSHTHFQVANRPELCCTTRALALETRWGICFLT